MVESSRYEEQSTPEELEEALLFAEQIARQAGVLTLQEREKVLQVEAKDDETSNIVTNGDRASEECIVNALRNRFPEDGIRGEEGSDISGTRREWIVDPIDGTYNYAHFKPYSVSIGLVEEGQSVLGVLHFPDTGVTLSATNGGGLQIYGKTLPHKNPKDLSEARVGFDVSSGGNEQQEITSFYKPLIQAQSLERIWCCTEAARRIVMGELDAYICGGGLTPFDLAGLTVILKEAGCAIEGVDDPMDFNRKKNPTIMAVHSSLLRNVRDAVRFARK